MPKRMSAKMADEVYTILVEECGADDHEDGSERRRFVEAQTREDDYFIYEYRFCGALGFGGKFWINDGRIYVNCYPEDQRKKEKDMIEKANKRLAEIQKKYNYNMYEI